MDQVLQRFLPLRLRVQELFFLFQKSAVASPHSQNSIGIHPAQLRHVGGDVLQKIAVVTDDHAGKCRLRQHFFEPLDSREIQMIGGFVEQHNVRRLHQRLDNRQPLLPSTRKRRSLRFEVFEAGAAKSFGKACPTFRRVNLAPLHGIFHHGPHRRARLELGILLDVADPEPFTKRNFAAVRIFVAGQNSQQRRFAGPIGADEPNAVALSDCKRHILKERIGSKSLGNFLNVNDRRQRLAVSLKDGVY